MRAVGNSRTPLYFLIFSSGVNVVLDFLFVVTWKFGVIGAAAATVIAETLSAVLCFLYICRCYRGFLPKREDWKPGKNLTLEMLSTGLSMGLMQSVFCFTVIPKAGYLGVVVTEPFIWVVCAGFMSFIYMNFSRKCLAG